MEEYREAEIAYIVAPDDLTTFLNDNAANIETVFHMGWFPRPLNGMQILLSDQITHCR